MDAHKIMKVLDVYETYFIKEKVPKKKVSPDVFPRLESDVLTHLHGMIDEMREFVRDGRMDKAFRWLGFMQGALWCQGIYTLEELKNHNRPR